MGDEQQTPPRKKQRTDHGGDSPEKTARPRDAQLSPGTALHVENVRLTMEAEREAAYADVVVTVTRILQARGWGDLVSNEMAKYLVMMFDPEIGLKTLRFITNLTEEQVYSKRTRVCIRGRLPETAAKFLILDFVLATYLSHFL